MKPEKNKIEKIESVTFIGTIITFLFFGTLKFMTGLFLLLGVVIGIKFYIYTLYKRQGKVNEFWKKTSKPAFASLAIISLLMLLDYYDVFLYKLFF